MVPGGHLQTLAGFYLPAKPLPYQAQMSLVEVPGADKIAIHDDCPAAWKPDDRVVLLLHGLAGCHQSGYVARLANRLRAHHIRCFRMDMRGSGAASGHAQQPGHAGRTEDAMAAIQFIEERCPHAPLSLVGFSLGGNIALSTAALASQRAIGNLDSCYAVEPPVDLSRCCRELQVGTGRFYDRYLVRWLCRGWIQNGGQLGDRSPRSVYEFDDLVTAPLSGYRDAEDYYAQCSSGPKLIDIQLPTTILAAKDDPMVAFAAIEAAPRSASVQLIATESGGHLGFICSRRHVDDRRWMDETICNWVLSR